MKKSPNDCLVELREKVEMLQKISENISIIDSLVKQNLTILQSELKDLEKRVCPTCDLIHSPYGTKKH